MVSSVKYSSNNGRNDNNTNIRAQVSMSHLLEAWCSNPSEKTTVIFISGLFNYLLKSLRRNSGFICVIFIVMLIFIILSFFQMIMSVKIPIHPGQRDISPFDKLKKMADDLLILSCCNWFPVVSGYLFFFLAWPIYLLNCFPASSESLYILLAWSAFSALIGAVYGTVVL